MSFTPGVYRYRTSRLTRLIQRTIQHFRRIAKRWVATPFRNKGVMMEEMLWFLVAMVAVFVALAGAAYYD